MQNKGEAKLDHASMLSPKLQWGTIGFHWRLKYYGYSRDHRHLFIVVTKFRTNVMKKSKNLVVKLKPFLKV